MLYEYTHWKEAQTAIDGVDEQDHAMICLLGELPCQPLSENDAATSMVQGREKLRLLAGGPDFGFEPMEWLRFLNSTYPYDRRYRREWFADAMERWVPYISSLPEYQRLKKLAESKWAATPHADVPPRVRGRRPTPEELETMLREAYEQAGEEQPKPYQP